MESLLTAFGDIFAFIDTVEIAGLKLSVWIMISLILSGIALFIRGNK